MKVVHDLNQHQKARKAPTHEEILLQDQARVDSIHSKLSKNSGLSDVKATGAATLPVKDGSTIGSGNYIVTVGLVVGRARLQVGGP